MNDMRSDVKIQRDISILEESQKNFDITLNALDKELRSKLKMSMNKSMTKIVVVSKWERNPTDINVGEG